jgi:hypothetical protein
MWQHKILAALGILDILLTSSGLAARALAGLMFETLERIPTFGPIVQQMPTPPRLVTLGQIGELYRLVAPYGTGGWLGLVTGAAVIAIALAVLGLTIEGGIIAAVGEIEQGHRPSVGRVFRAGWRRILPMVVIASVPAIPLTLGAILVVAAASGAIQSAGGLSALSASAELAQTVGARVTLVALAVLCPTGLITPPLALLSVMAYRPCILEELGAAASLRRAWGVLRARLGAVLLLVAISLGVSLMATTLTSLPDLLAEVFLPAIGVMWLVQGMARATTLILWTLGWKAWTAGEGLSRAR